MEFKLQTIGVIHTPFLEPAGTPIQPSRARGARGEVVIEEPFRRGLQDIEGFDRIWLVYWFHKAAAAAPLVTPYLDTQQHGIFATRAPARPCAIGISVARLVGLHDGVLYVQDVDMIDGTPLLDVKPYVPEFDSYPTSKAGWLDESKFRCRLADDRFQRREALLKPEK